MTLVLVDWYQAVWCLHYEKILLYLSDLVSISKNVVFYAFTLYPSPLDVWNI